jgi:Protein of unknown function (DUF1997)
MQANSANHQPIETSNPILGITSGLIDSRMHDVAEPACQETEPTYFHGYYANCMEMGAGVQTVAQYMDAHRDWFHRCAHPMKVTPLGENGYALTIGRFGAFGYEVEPKIGLDLLPPDQGVYRITTIPIPDYEPLGYEVDFQAAMLLVEAGDATAPMTRVEWELNLEVSIHFPRFIQALPQHMVRSTGDRLLNQVVRQVSRCLTQKVQEDFHKSVGIPLIKKNPKKYPWSRSSEPINWAQSDSAE